MTIASFANNAIFGAHFKLLCVSCSQFLSVANQHFLKVEDEITFKLPIRLNGILSWVGKNHFLLSELRGAMTVLFVVKI